MDLFEAGLVSSFRSAKRRRVGDLRRKKKLLNPLKTDYALRHVLTFLDPFAIFSTVPRLSKWHWQWIRQKAGIAYWQQIVDLNLGAEFTRNVLPTVREWLRDESDSGKAVNGSALFGRLLAAANGLQFVDDSSLLRYALGGDTPKAELLPFYTVVYGANGRIAHGFLQPLLKRTSSRCLAEVTGVLCSLRRDDDEFQKWMTVGFLPALKRLGRKMAKAKRKGDAISSELNTAAVSLLSIPFVCVQNVVSFAGSSELFSARTVAHLRLALCCFEARSRHWAHWKRIADCGEVLAEFSADALFESLIQALAGFVYELAPTEAVAKAYATDSGDFQKMQAICDCFLRAAATLKSAQPTTGHLHPPWLRLLQFAEDDFAQFPLIQLFLANLCKATFN